MKVLFLDIDGVLNAHEFNEKAQSTTMRRDCVDQLNRVIEETDCYLVISSAWRYNITRGEMTVKGFGHLLQSHGVMPNRVIGHTREDKYIEEARATQILEWLDAPYWSRFAVVDDLPIHNSSAGKKIQNYFGQTDGAIGLTPKNADELIRILNEP
jgi:hypothetical protein